MIAERLSGKKIQELMSELIFRPLGMKDSYLEKRNDAGVVRGYADIYNNGTLMDVSHWDRAEGDGEADGGLISTAADLHKFMRALFSGDLISDELLTDMKRIQLSTCNSPNCEYGLGLELWRTNAGIAYGHNGGLVGIEANALYFEETGGIYVAFKNNGNGSRKTLLEDLMK
jgi:D-alanyl-D-alanine carboxypeptidase